ncbi:type I-B CRISPR-associated protein Cas7/Cst2/DevR [Eubacterium sp.]|uniref:type I-B CRISPR-associated protein Cas7/Cst2/DevR n=1 Tax=Eubacterium sp. TaxID=142586 RepID=UPI0039954C84
MRKALTLTIVANMTSNYSEGLGNISSVQKIFRNQKIYAIRSKESLKNAICQQAGMYDDLKTQLDGAMQKFVSDEVNASNCRALEGGYMNTSGITYVRNSSFYLTDAVACDSFVNETRFHNNLYLATSYAKDKGLNVQNNSKDVGLMPYQYEFDKSLKKYSITIDLDQVGKDANFDMEATNEEKAFRVKAILTAVENLALVVKGNLDNAEPLFAVGGISDRKTHYFENVVNVKGKQLVLSEDLKERINNNYHVALVESGVFDNELEIISELNVISMSELFNKLRSEVDEYYGCN